MERQLAKAAASEKADIEASLVGLTVQVRAVVIPGKNKQPQPTPELAASSQLQS